MNSEDAMKVHTVAWLCTAAVLIVGFICWGANNYNTLQAARPVVHLTYDSGLFDE